MKRLRYLVVLLAVLSIVGVFESNAEAADWYICDVISVGPSLNTVMIYLTDRGGTFTNKAFNTGSDAARTNRMLAVALTAESLDRPVRVSVDTAVAPTVITSCYMWN